MKCKICQRNEIDSTSGICWECASKSYNVPIVEPPLDMGEGYTNYSPKEEPEDLTQVNKNYMREKLLQILSAKTPPEAKYHGGVVDWQCCWTKDGVEFLIDEIIFTLIESLPEFKDVIVGSNEEPLTEMDTENRGWNSYRSEVINLFRGN